MVVLQPCSAHSKSLEKSHLSTIYFWIVTFILGSFYTLFCFSWLLFSKTTGWLAALQWSIRYPNLQSLVSWWNISFCSFRRYILTFGLRIETCYISSFFIVFFWHCQFNCGYAMSNLTSKIPTKHLYFTYPLLRRICFFSQICYNYDFIRAKYAASADGQLFSAGPHFHRKYMRSTAPPLSVFVFDHGSCLNMYLVIWMTQNRSISD